MFLCISVCVCVHVCEKASELDLRGPSATGPQGRTPLLLLCSSLPWVPAQKDHATCALPARDLGDVRLQERPLALSPLAHSVAMR